MNRTLLIINANSGSANTVGEEEITEGLQNAGFDIAQLLLERGAKSDLASSLLYTASQEDCNQQDSEQQANVLQLLANAVTGSMIHEHAL